MASMPDSKQIAAGSVDWAPMEPATRRAGPGWGDGPACITATGFSRGEQEQV
jgi:hypothetical protein